MVFAFAFVEFEHFYVCHYERGKKLWKKEGYIVGRFGWGMIVEE